jgi:uncharacterized protein YbjQ (UPF0145 family)
VDVRAEAKDYGDTSMSSGLIEYAVLGTAVRRERAPAAAPGRSADRGVVLTELTVADYAKLLSAGIEPAGIVGWSSVCFSTYGWTRSAGVEPALPWVAQESFELPGFTRAIYAARERVMERLGAQAQTLGASGIVGVRLHHDMSRQALGPGAANGLVVSFHAIGTAVHDHPGARPQAPRTTVDLLS